MTSVLRGAKILCTLGPASNTAEAIGALMDAGLNGCRLNFSHGSADDHKRLYQTIRDEARRRDRAICILADLQGPKIRVGRLPGDGIEIRRGEELILTVDAAVENYDGKRIRVDYDRLAAEAKVGDQILLDDGELELRITKIVGPDLFTEVIVGGKLKSRKGVNLPGTDLTIPSMTDKDEEDLRLAIELGVDLVALSFVRSPIDLEVCRTHMRNFGKTIPLIAKVEMPQAVANLEAIVASADGIMVARGDLGVEMGPEEVPMIQKRIIELCNEAGKLVITATQMLDSMIRNPRPTRAEASDVANAVLDGTDTVMLSGETASGSYPMRAVETMARIIVRAEQDVARRSTGPHDLQLNHDANAIARAAVSSSMSLSECRAIIAYTGSGGTARLISTYRPHVPIYAFTPESHTYNRLALYWGVIPVNFTPNTQDGETIFADLDQAILRRNLLKPGELVVITLSWPIRAQKSVNLLKIHRVGEALQP
jgi:pyruvate kinase